MTSRLARTRLVVVLLATVVAAACGTSTPTPSPTAVPTVAPTAAPTDIPSPSADPTEAPSEPSAAACDEAPPASPAAEDPASAAVYDAIEQQVQDLRSLRATTKVERDVFDRAALCAYLKQQFAAHNPPELVRGTETLYKQLALLPENASLQDLSLELLTSQVAGLYDDETKKMYVVSTADAPGPLEKFVYSHEFTHAITDQAFGLRSVVGEATDQSDRTMARSALVEGDATLLMSLWAQGNLTPAELLAAAGAADPASQAVLDRMPAILKDPLTFPYTSGLQVALNGYATGGYGAVDDLYRNPPDSTEQVLHAEKLASREAPVPVAFPDDLATRLGDGWTVTLQDTFGEELLEIILRDGGASGTADAAAGWGGDRVALIEGPGDEVAVVLDTAWDTEADAAAFEAALAPTVEKLKAAGKSPAVLRPDPSRVVLVTAESPDTLGRVANVLGLAG